MPKPYSESCAENRQPIFNVLNEVFADRTRVLEIGSGTGQHAVDIGGALTHLQWQTSDVLENHQGINLWLQEAGLANVLPPLALAVDKDPWPEQSYDAVFSANTVHIMSWPQVCDCFAGIGRVLESGGVFALYGPFNYGGKATAESNVRFDGWLKARDPLSGVRDFDDLNRLAEEAGMRLIKDQEVPANNRILVWQK